MSLDVTEPEVQLAARGEMSDEAFIGIIERSLPFAYSVVERHANGLKHGATIVFDQPPHMYDADRDQLLRVFASTSMRTALEKHFDIARLAFQNCHFTAAANDEGTRSEQWRYFISPRGQVLAQSPALRDC